MVDAVFKPGWLKRCLEQASKADADYRHWLRFKDIVCESEATIEVVNQAHVERMKRWPLPDKNQKVVVFEDDL